VQDSPSRISTKFSKSHRLLRTDGFDHVIRSEDVSDSHYKVCFVKNNKKNARLGIIASKRTFFRAIDRNRVKRIVREKFRKHHIKSCKLDVVVIIKHGFSNKIGANVDKLDRLFSQVENICSELQLR
jgi:ribonuclease P protein component